MKPLLRQLMCLIMCLCFAQLTYAATTLLDVSLPDLRSHKNISLGNYPNKILLISFFEPDCAWCYRQMKTFNRLLEHCHHLQPIGVGINGNRQALRKELRKAKARFPGLIANRALLDSLGTIPATPWTLVVNPQGEQLATLRGYHKLSQLGPALGCQPAG